MMGMTVRAVVTHWRPLEITSLVKQSLAEQGGLLTFSLEVLTLTVSVFQTPVSGIRGDGYVAVALHP